MNKTCTSPQSLLFFNIMYTRGYNNEANLQSWAHSNFFASCQCQHPLRKAFTCRTDQAFIVAPMHSRQQVNVPTTMPSVDDYACRQFIGAKRLLYSTALYQPLPLHQTNPVQQTATSIQHTASILHQAHSIQHTTFGLLYSVNFQYIWHSLLLTSSVRHIATYLAAFHCQLPSIHPPRYSTQLSTSQCQPNAYCKFAQSSLYSTLLASTVLHTAGLLSTMYPLYSQSLFQLIADLLCIAYCYSSFHNTLLASTEHCKHTASACCTVYRYPPPYNDSTLLEPPMYSILY